MDRHLWRLSSFFYLKIIFYLIFVILPVWDWLKFGLQVRIKLDFCWTSRFWPCERYHFCHTVMVDCIFFFWCWWCCRWREELILSAAPPGASWRRWKLWQLVPYLYYTWTPISHRAITTTKSAPDRWDSSTSQLFNHHTRSSRSTNIIELINPRQKFSKIVSFLTRAKSEISKKIRIYETWSTRYIKIQLRLTSSLKMFTNCSLRKLKIHICSSDHATSDQLEFFFGTRKQKFRKFRKPKLIWQHEIWICRKSILSLPRIGLFQTLFDDEKVLDPK